MFSFPFIERLNVPMRIYLKATVRVSIRSPHNVKIMQRNTSPAAGRGLRRKMSDYTYIALSPVVLNL